MEKVTKDDITYLKIPDGWIPTTCEYNGIFLELALPYNSSMSSASPMHAIQSATKKGTPQKSEKNVRSAVPKFTINSERPDNTRNSRLPISARHRYSESVLDENLKSPVPSYVIHNDDEGYDVANDEDGICRQAMKLKGNKSLKWQRLEQSINNMETVMASMQQTLKTMKNEFRELLIGMHVLM
jgi:hypothetical protein